MLIPENRQKAILIILPFINDLASILSNSVSAKSIFYDFYKGNIRLLIDYIVLVSIVWSSCIVTYDYDSILAGFLHGCLTLVLSYILPDVFMKSVIKSAGNNRNLGVAYSVMFVILLIIAETWLERIIDALL